MTQEELNVILDKHKLWLEGEEGGERADLSEANLFRANLFKANLSRANLSRANLSEANLSGADLSGANLCRANLHAANLHAANLSEANLSEATLYGADLSGANLCRSNLCGAKLYRATLHGAKLPHFQICPEEGSFVGWKKLKGGLIAKLLIPEKARRTSTLVGRKCRAECVQVLELEGGVSWDHFKGETKYVLGEMVYPDKYDDDIRVECTHGIHFFMTMKEAEEY